MKDLSEIDDEYEGAIETLTETYKDKISSGTPRKDAKEIFDKKLNELLKKRNKSSEKYIKKHKEELLGMPESKKKKQEKSPGEFHTKHITLERGFIGKINLGLRLFYFKLKITSRKIFDFLIPSFLKKITFRIIIFIKSIYGGIFLILSNILSKIKGNFIKLFEKSKILGEKILSKLKILKDYLLKKIKDLKSKLEKKDKKTTSNPEEKPLENPPQKVEETS